MKNWLRPLPLTTILFLIAMGFFNTIWKVDIPADGYSRLHLWISIGRQQEIIKELEPMIAAQPRNLDLQYQYLRAVNRLPTNSQYQVRIEQKYQSMLSDPAWRDNGAWGLGWQALLQGQAEQALDYFHQVEGGNLKYLEFGKGNAYLQMQNVPDAVSALQKEVQNGGAADLAKQLLFSTFVRYDRLEDASRLLAAEQEYLMTTVQPAVRAFALATGNLQLLWETWVQRPATQVDPVAVASAIFISVIWFFFFWRIDVFEQDPVWVGVLVLFLGALMAIFSIPLEDAARLIYPAQINGNWFNDLIHRIVTIGMVEELLKILPLLLIIKTNKQVNEPVDVLIYGSLSALGFATIENIIVISQMGEQVLVARLLIATLMHIVSTAVIAYAWANARYIQRMNLWLAGLLGWLASAMLHGLFDFLVLSDNPISLWGLLVLILSVWGYSLMLRNALNFSPFFAAPKLEKDRLTNYEWILSAGIWLLMIGYVYFNFSHATQIANVWLLSNIWTTLPTILGIFAALGELSLSKGEHAFP